MIHTPFVPNMFATVGVLVYGVVVLAVIAAIVFIAILLIRFLLVGTRAARLYISQHEPRSAAPTVEAGQPPAAE